MGRTWNKTCEECGDPFVASGVRQRECDSCWAAARGAVRVEYRSNGSQRHRCAVYVCGGCGNEYATRHNDAKYPGLCP